MQVAPLRREREEATSEGSDSDVIASRMEAFFRIPGE